MAAKDKGGKHAEKQGASLKEKRPAKKAKKVQCGRNRRVRL